MKKPLTFGKARCGAEGFEPPTLCLWADALNQLSSKLPLKIAWWCKVSKNFLICKSLC